jgi:hypothetical protein
MINIRIILILIFFLIILLCIFNWKSNHRDYSHSNEKISVNEIIPHLYLGNKYAAINKNFLIRNNIKGIINVATGVNVDFDQSKFPWIDYLNNVKIHDRPDVILSTNYKKIFDFIDDKIYNHQQNVLIHCSRGISRSASYVIAYLMKKFQMKFQEAYDYVKMMRPIINPNQGFITQLKSQSLLI